MKITSPTTIGKLKLQPLLLATSLLSCAAIAPQVLAEEYSAASNEATHEAHAVLDKPRQTQSKTKTVGQKKSKPKAGNDSTDGRREKHK